MPRWPGDLTVLLLAGAAAASRVAGDAGAATVLGYLALPLAFLGGMLGAAGQAPLAHFGALELLSGFAAALLAAALAAVAVADGAGLFLGAAGAALLGTGGAWLDYAFGSVGLTGAAALMAALALGLTTLIPAAAFRIGRLTDAAAGDPPTPTNCGGTRSPCRAARCLPGPRPPTGWSPAWSRASAWSVARAAVALALGHGWLPRLMCGVLGCALLLRSRVFHGRAQRLWLQVPGYGGLVLLAVAAGHGKMIAITLVPLAAGAAILVVAGTWLAGHRPSPFWGRAAEIVDMVLVIALVPLALGVAGVFSDIRGLSG